MYKKWGQCLLDNPHLKEFSLDRVLPLQAISLVQTSRRTKIDPDVRIRCTRAALYDLQPQNFEGVWDDVTTSMNWCLGLLKGEAGVLVPKWLPYSALLVAMTATMVNSRDDGVSPDDLKRKLLRWFWCSVFAGSYTSGTNTKNARDFLQLTDWLRGGSPPYTVAAFDSLFGPSPLQGLVSTKEQFVFF